MCFRYCVAIRTLGKAGEKYQRELESIDRQTIKASKILVYIAEGYPLPKETIGKEEYIRVPKGMVSQRALPYNEVDTPYVLLLDDDVELAPDSVEKLYKGLQDMHGDCIAVDAFANHKASTLAKIKGAITNWAFPRFKDGYAFKVQNNASFTYNNNPSNDVCPSESAAGPASFWRLEALRRIHFEDELWMDKLGFAYGEDLLFFNKLVKNKGRLLVHYNSGAKHLDAQSSRGSYANNPRRFLIRAQMWFILWWRACYDLPSLSSWRKFFSALSFTCKCLWNTVIVLMYSLFKLSFSPLKNHVRGMHEGWKFVHGETYAKIPNFIIDKNR